jgi:hypothetical protein
MGSIVEPIKLILEKGWRLSLPILLTLTIFLFITPDLFANLREYFLAGWFASVVFLAIGVAAGIIRRMVGTPGDKQEKPRSRKELQNLIDALTDDERAVMRQFVSLDRRSLELPASNNAAWTLGQRKIIRIPTLIRYTPGDDRIFKFTIAEDVWLYLQDEKRTNPNLLDPKPKT